MKLQGLNYCDGCRNKSEGKDPKDIIEEESTDYSNDLDSMGQRKEVNKLYILIHKQASQVSGFSNFLF